MDFSVIFQLRTKKFWWMDVIFYFVIALLMATIFCYIIFLTKNNFQREDIKEQDAALQTVGTYQQKEYEKNVISYRNKINDFNSLFKNHEFASNVFVFMRAQTMPNIWFKQFGLDKRNNIVQLSGESDDMDAFSRQVKIFEDEKNKKYVTNIGNLNSSLGESARVNFNTNLTLDKNIFSYLSSLPSIVETTSPSDGTIITPPIDEQQNPQTGSTEKLITFFHLLLNPEVSGLVDQTNYKITLDVPYGTDIKNLTPSIIISSNATVSPTSRAQQDFTNPVTYTVTAQDGSTRDYKVTVNILPQVESGQPKWAIWVITILIIIVVAIVAILGFLFWKRIKNQKLNI